VPADPLVAVRLTCLLIQAAVPIYGRDECRRMVVARSNGSRTNRSRSCNHSLDVTTHRHLNGRTPQYLSTYDVYCAPVSSMTSRQQRHLCSAAGHHLAVLPHRLSTYGCRSFSVAAQVRWNSAVA